MCAADEHLDKQEATTNDEQEATTTDTIEEQEVASDENECEDEFECDDEDWDDCECEDEDVYEIVIMPTHDLEGRTLTIHTPTRFTNGGEIWLDLVYGDDSTDAITDDIDVQVMLWKLAAIFRETDNINRSYGLCAVDKTLRVQIPHCDDCADAVDTIAFALLDALQSAYGEAPVIAGAYDQRYEVRDEISSYLERDELCELEGDDEGRDDLDFYAHVVNVELAEDDVADEPTENENA